MYMLYQRSNDMFAGIGGSRCLGIEREGSDIDLLIISNYPKYKIRMKGSYNTLYREPQDFFNQLTSLDAGYIHIYQYLYPYQFMTDGYFTQWIINNRDELVSENRRAMFNTIYRYVEYVYNNFDIFFKIARKRVVYALCYGETLYQYLNNVSLTDCMRASGKWQETLRSVFKRDVSYDDTFGLLNNIRSEIATFDDSVKEIADKPITQELQMIINNTIFDDYADSIVD